MTDSDLLVLSANCQGQRDKKKQADVINYLNRKNPSFLCLQDTHWTNEDEKYIKKLWKGECIINGNRTNSRGVAILINTNIEYSVKKIHKDQNGNLLMLDISINNMIFRLFNVYTPNTDSPAFFHELCTLIQEGAQDYTLICSDLNLTLNANMDACNYKHLNNPQSRPVLINTMNNSDLIDFFRTIHPKTKRYTWRRQNPIKQARLDYFIGSQTLLDLITKCNINAGYRSDHSSIELILKLSEFKRGKGIWKFNCSLLKDKEYLDLINKTIKDEMVKYTAKVYNMEKIDKISFENIHLMIGDRLFLETLLLEMRGTTIQYSTRLKKNRLMRNKN